MAFEPMVALWDGEKLFQEPLSVALALVAEGKAQRAEDHYTGRGLMRRSEFSAYQTKVMVAGLPAANEPETEIAPKKRGRPRKEVTEQITDKPNEAEVGDETSDED